MEERPYFQGLGSGVVEGEGGGGEERSYMKNDDGHH